jgi:hypothetical protein
MHLTRLHHLRPLVPVSVFPGLLAVPGGATVPVMASGGWDVGLGGVIVERESQEEAGKSQQGRRWLLEGRYDLDVRPISSPLLSLGNSSQPL